MNIKQQERRKMQKKRRLQKACGSKASKRVGLSIFFESGESKGRRISVIKHSY